MGDYRSLLRAEVNIDRVVCTAQCPGKRLRASRRKSICRLLPLLNGSLIVGQLIGYGKAHLICWFLVTNHVFTFFHIYIRILTIENSNIISVIRNRWKREENQQKKNVERRHRPCIATWLSLVSATILPSGTQLSAVHLICFSLLDANTLRGTQIKAVISKSLSQLPSSR